MAQETIELLTIPQAAQLIGISRATVNRFVSEGKLGSVKLGRSRRILREQLAEFVAAGRRDASNN